MTDNDKHVMRIAEDLTRLVNEDADIFDYFENSIYDIVYMIGDNNDFRGCRIMVGCGGPNIYVDTYFRKVELFWGASYAYYPLDYYVCERLNAHFELMRCC